jgi:L-2-hydroxyglutarate oxidase LhgO
MAGAGDDVGTVDITGTGPVQVRCTSESLVAAVEERKEGGYRVRVKVADGAKTGRVMAKLVVSTAGDGAQELEVPVMGIVR